MRSCRCSVTQHETVSTLMLCSASGSVTCGLHLHCTAHLGVMLRSVEASVQGHLSERRRLRHQERSGPVHRQAVSLSARLLEDVKRSRSLYGRHPASGPSHHRSSVRSCVQFASISQAPQGPHLLSRDSHGPRVGPSWPAWRVISAITSFGPPLS